MKRDLVINIVLIVVGVVLAFLLFAAGVRWKSKTPTARPSASIAGPCGTNGAGPCPGASPIASLATNKLVDVFVSAPSKSIGRVLRRELWPVASLQP